MTSSKPRLSLELLCSQGEGVDPIIGQFGEKNHAGHAGQPGRRTGRKASQLVQLDGRHQAQFISQFFWTHLERQKGGIGLRGPGEKQLELDKRMLNLRIKQIKKGLTKKEFQH